MQPSPPRRARRITPERDRGHDDASPAVQSVATGSVKTPHASDRLCASPLGGEWPVAQAVMGTVMDVLVHTWDLATATGQPVVLDPLLVAVCVETFLPDTPERGREAGLVGAAVPVGPDAEPAVRLLGAMGRRA